MFKKLLFLLSFALITIVGCSLDSSDLESNENPNDGITTETEYEVVPSKDEKFAPITKETDSKPAPSTQPAKSAKSPDTITLALLALLLITAGIIVAAKPKNKKKKIENKVLICNSGGSSGNSDEKFASLKVKNTNLQTFDSLAPVEMFQGLRYDKYTSLAMKQKPLMVDLAIKTTVNMPKETSLDN
jgi:hypothetical protein